MYNRRFMMNKGYLSFMINIDDKYQSIYNLGHTKNKVFTYT